MNGYNVANHIDYMQRIAMLRKQMAINDRENLKISCCQRNSRMKLRISMQRDLF